MLDHCVRCIGNSVPEDVRMAADQFIAYAIDDISHRELTRFLSELRLDEHLEKQVSQFLAKLLRVCGLESLERLVCLFQEIRSQRLVSLDLIPRAAVGSSKRRDDAPQPSEGGRTAPVPRHTEHVFDIGQGP